MADTAHDADDLPDYLADLAILLSGYQYRTGDQPGHVVRHAYCDGAKAVTVEVFARWVHDGLSPAVAAAGGEALAVRVWETPIAFGGYRARC